MRCDLVDLAEKYMIAVCCCLMWCFLEGCYGKETDGRNDWMPIGDREVGGWLSASQYLSIAEIAFSSNYPTIDMSSFSHDLPYRDEQNSLFNKSDSVYVQFLRCNTPQNLRQKILPLEVETISVILSKGGSVRSCNRNSNVVPADVTEHSLDFWRHMFSRSLGTATNDSITYQPYEPLMSRQRSCE